MKKITSKILILGALILMSSCKKSLLDQDSPNTLTVEQYWKTESDAKKV
ncbi:hypothetical protein [Pedobacter steynii]